MNKRSNYSAGVLMYQYNSDKTISIFLVHPGGPFWFSKTNGAWSIPKGEFDSKKQGQEGEGEDSVKSTAVRELFEETNLKLNESDLKIDLGHVKQNKSKTVFAYAYENVTWSEKEFKCNSFTEIEYPPHSGKKLVIPEVDQGKFFTVEECKQYMNQKQFEFISRLLIALSIK